MHESVSLNETETARIARALQDCAARNPGWDQTIDPATRAAIPEHLAACIQRDDSGNRVGADSYAVWLASVLHHRGAPMAAISDLLSALNVQPTQPKYETPTPAGEVRDLPDFVSALLSGDLPNARRIFQAALADGATPTKVGVCLLQPALDRIGRLWEENRITIEREHLATAITAHLLTEAYALVPPPEPSGSAIVLACVPGNHHDVGLRLVADACLQHGRRVVYLGTDVPWERLANAVREERPGVVGLSIALPNQVVTARELIEKVRSTFAPQPPRILIGGAALRRVPRLRETIQADLFCVDALAAADLLTTVL